MKAFIRHHYIGDRVDESFADALEVVDVFLPFLDDRLEVVLKDDRLSAHVCQKLVFELEVGADQVDVEVHYVRDAGNEGL
jgi:hypothetical protein